MRDAIRKLPRFADFGRVEAPALCAIPGVLDDISIEGCKVHFPVEVVVDPDADYEIKVRPSRRVSEVPFMLICHPQWNRIEDGTTHIGFKVLRSPDTWRLTQYIEQLYRESSEEEVENQIKDPVCQIL